MLAGGDRRAPVHPGRSAVPPAHQMETADRAAEGLPALFVEFVNRPAPFFWEKRVTDVLKIKKRRALNGSRHDDGNLAFVKFAQKAMLFEYDLPGPAAVAVKLDDNPLTRIVFLQFVNPVDVAVALEADVAQLDLNSFFDCRKNIFRRQ